MLIRKEAYRHVPSLFACCIFSVIFKADIFRKKIIEFNDIHRHTNQDDTCSKKIKLESLFLDKFHFL